MFVSDSTLFKEDLYDEVFFRTNQNSTKEPKERGSSYLSNDVTPYRCLFCNALYRKYNAFVEHKKSHFLPKNRFQCETCTETFGSSADLLSHKEVEHYEKTRQQPPHKDYNYQCTKCKEVFMYRCQLVVHELDVHGARLTTTQPINYKLMPALVPIVPDAPVLKHQCHFCEEKFPSTKARTAHEQSKHWVADSTIKCHLCYLELPIKSMSKMIEHKRDVHNVDFEGKKVTKLKDPDYVCQDCGSTFSMEDTYRSHILKRHGVKSGNVCKICNQKFPHPHALMMHINEVHPGQGVQAQVVSPYLKSL